MVSQQRAASVGARDQIFVRFRIIPREMRPSLGGDCLVLVVGVCWLELICRNDAPWSGRPKSLEYLVSMRCRPIESVSPLGLGVIEPGILVPDLNKDLEEFYLGAFKVDLSHT